MDFDSLVKDIATNKSKLLRDNTSWRPTAKPLSFGGALRAVRQHQRQGAPQPVVPHHNPGVATGSLKSSLPLSIASGNDLEICFVALLIDLLCLGLWGCFYLAKPTTKDQLLHWADMTKGDYSHYPHLTKLPPVGYSEGAEPRSGG